MNNPEVSVLRCTQYGADEVYLTVKGMVELLGGMDRFVQAGERILVKPNLLAGAVPESAVTTHPSVVGAVVRLVKEAGATPVVGDSPGIGTAKKNAGPSGIMDVCRAHDVEFTELKTLVLVENPTGRIFKRLEVASEVLGVDGVINVAKLKTHAQMYLTMGVKNLFGCVPGKRKPQWHLAAGVSTDTFASMLLDLHFFINPRLTVMDAIVGMEGNGPSSGDPRKMGLLFASMNAVAMDRVAAEIVGARIKNVPILRVAAEQGLGGAQLSDIDVLGVSVNDIDIKGFTFPPPMDVDFAKRLPSFISKRLRNALTSRPHIDPYMCTLCNTCVSICPSGVMTQEDRIIIDYDGCIRCYCCHESCPEGAITVRDGWLKKLLPGM